MTISIIVIPSVIHQGNDTRVPNVTFIPFCAQRQAAPPSPPLLSPSLTLTLTLPSIQKGLITHRRFFFFFVLLLVSGRAMCYLTKNNNEGDGGKCNLIPLIQLPLSPPVTGRWEAITVQRWHRFWTRRRWEREGERKKERSASCLSLEHINLHHHHIYSLLFFLFPRFLHSLMTYFLFDNYSPLLASDGDSKRRTRFNYRRSHSAFNFLDPGVIRINAHTHTHV